MRALHTKAQVSTEFLMTVGLVTLIFVGVFSIAHKVNIDTAVQSRDTERINECARITNMLSSIFVLGEGAVFNSTTTFLINITEDQAVTILPDDAKGGKSLTCYAMSDVEPVVFSEGFSVQQHDGVIRVLNWTYGDVNP